ncbi:MAG: hypothetical protein V3V01_14230 [Acidimicrobiales bacterium]
MKQLQKHRIDRTALIFGLVFSLAGLAYLADDHNIFDVTEGAAAGGFVIIVGLVMLVLALIESPSAGVEPAPETAPPVGPPARSPSETSPTGRLFDPAEPTVAAPDFSWAATSERTDSFATTESLSPEDLPGEDESE